MLYLQLVIRKILRYFKGKLALRKQAPRATIGLTPMHVVAFLLFSWCNMRVHPMYSSVMHHVQRTMTTMGNDLFRTARPLLSTCGIHGTLLMFYLKFCYMNQPTGGVMYWILWIYDHHCNKWTCAFDIFILELCVLALIQGLVHHTQRLQILTGTL